MRGRRGGAGGVVGVVEVVVGGGATCWILDRSCGIGFGFGIGILEVREWRRVRRKEGMMENIVNGAMSGRLRRELKG